MWVPHHGKIIRYIWCISYLSKEMILGVIGICVTPLTLGGSHTCGGSDLQDPDVGLRGKCSSIGFIE